MDVSSRALRLPSFAKINWSLQVLGRRRDGYHEVRTVLQTVSLHDDLELEASRRAGLKLSVTGLEAPADESNLVLRAARLLQQAAGAGQGARIRLHKRIPLGAGLGGGSGNAATALMALNRLWECGLSPAQLQELAGTLGSDVCFFLHGGTALAWGRGEKIEVLPDVLPRVDLTLVYPGFEVPTAHAYSLLESGFFKRDDNLTKDMVDTTIRRLRGAGEKAQEWAFLGNDFEGPLLSAYPRLREVRELLRKAGFHKVMLCGSGSTLFGVGGLPEGRLALAKSAAGSRVLSCTTLSRDDFRRHLQPIDGPWLN